MPEADDEFANCPCDPSADPPNPWIEVSVPVPIRRIVAFEVTPRFAEIRRHCDGHVNTVMNPVREERRELADPSDRRNSRQ